MNNKQDIESIRDIIFGSRLEELEQKIDALTQDNIALHQTIDSLKIKLRDSERKLRKQIPDWLKMRKK